jgi:hypothetical protein
MSINQTVNVSAFYFQNSQGLRSFPRQIEWGNMRYTFKDGLQYNVGKGPRAVKLFDMSDGETTYRLRLQDDTWTLIGTRNG